jgi:molybdopterin-guanine dinucleotide biosynthesis protein A
MKIIVIALAGGKSSRMGRDKTLLEINGETLLFKTCRTALEVADTVYVVVRSRLQYDMAIADFLSTHRSVKNLSMVIDQQFDGALVGFWQGLQAISEPTDWILLLACDLPNLQSDILQIWAAHLADLPESAIAYLPRHTNYDSNKNPNDNLRKQWEPLCGFYRWSCRDSLMEFINQGGRSFQKWLENLEVVEIENVAASMLFNCNTPKDFDSVQSISPLG